MTLGQDIRDITYCVTFLYECPDLWFDFFNEIHKGSVALHHPTRHDKDLGASHCVTQGREKGGENIYVSNRKAGTFGICISKEVLP